MEEQYEDAIATVKFAILSAIADNSYKNDPEILVQAIYDKIFEPHLVWAIKQVVNEFKAN